MGQLKGREQCSPASMLGSLQPVEPCCSGSSGDRGNDDGGGGISRKFGWGGEFGIATEAESEHENRASLEMGMELEKYYATDETEGGTDSTRNEVLQSVIYRGD
ncbi:hypothetical protein M0802_015940 [Mischocyttarus mexicanus]|nr:hypothetical protein M0802_015940 [Mischocyttarus mexicanus]